MRFRKAKTSFSADEEKGKAKRMRTMRRKKQVDTRENVTRTRKENVRMRTSRNENDEV